MAPLLSCDRLFLPPLEDCLRFLDLFSFKVAVDFEEVILSPCCLYAVHSQCFHRRLRSTGLNLPVVVITTLKHEGWRIFALDGTLDEPPRDVPSPVTGPPDIQVTKGALGAPVSHESPERSV